MKKKNQSKLRLQVDFSESIFNLLKQKARKNPIHINTHTHTHTKSQRFFSEKKKKILYMKYLLPLFYKTGKINLKLIKVMISLYIYTHTQHISRAFF